MHNIRHLDHNRFQDVFANCIEDIWIDKQYRRRGIGACSTVSVAAPKRIPSKTDRCAQDHVVPGRVTALKILEARELKNASGGSLPTSDLSVIRADIPARNGIIHWIDQVLLPSS